PLRLKPGRRPFQIDVLDPSVERSTEGALPFYPRGLVLVTDGGLDYIKAQVPAAAADLEDIALPRAPQTGAPALPFSTPKEAFIPEGSMDLPPPTGIPEEPVAEDPVLELEEVVEETEDSSSRKRKKRK